MVSSKQNSQISQDSSTNPILIHYLLDRLVQLNVEHVFGIPGDYSFPILDAVLAHKRMRWVQSSNELNAAYAADGYARARGFSALCTTCGVGELSALNGVAGAYAENLPVIHIVGYPKRIILEKGLPVHHSFGGNLDAFLQIARQVSCAAAIISSEQSTADVDELLKQAVLHRKPVYIGICSDDCAIPIQAQPLQTSIKLPSKFGSSVVQDVAQTIFDRLIGCQKGVIIIGFLMQRYNLMQRVKQLVDLSGLPYTILATDKGIIENENDPQFLGVCQGHMQNPKIFEYVKACDFALWLGTHQNDWNTMFFKDPLPKENSIECQAYETRLESEKHIQVYMWDVLEVVVSKLKTHHHNITPKHTSQLNSNGLGYLTSENGKGPKPESVPNFSNFVSTEGFKEPQGQFQIHDKLDLPYVYYCIQEFLKPCDTVTLDVGVCASGFIEVKLPVGVTMWTSGYWMSIGASLGQCLGLQIGYSDNRRSICIVGDGSIQMTIQEIGTYKRYNLKPIIFVFNNNGYLVERILSEYPEAEYNDIQPWRYSQVPNVFGCDDWITLKATNIGEFQHALQTINENPSKAAFIEIIVDRYASNAFFQRFQSIAFK